jgi:hypothetical protein
MQRIIRFDLKEEGNHVLAVNVSYIETTPTSRGSENPRGTNKPRSFRKLYQFLAQPCLSVRTKSSELASVEVPDKSLGPYGRSTLVRFALEAHLENVSDGAIVLENASLRAKKPFVAWSLNWGAAEVGAGSEGGSVEDVEITKPILNPRDVLQVAYVVEQEASVTEGLEELKAGLKRDGRVVLGQLAIQWRGNMGEPGSLSTGNLLSRKRA